MVAIKANQATAFLSKPDPKIRCVLLFGPDAGLVSERSQKLAQLLANREQPPGEVVRMDDADLENDLDRLSVELLTVPMFGGAKIVRAHAGRRLNAALVKPLLDGAALPGALIVEAGALRPDEGFRALFEKSPAAVAIGCSPPPGSAGICRGFGRGSCYNRPEDWNNCRASCRRYPSTSALAGAGVVGGPSAAAA